MTFPHYSYRTAYIFLKYIYLFIQYQSLNFPGDVWSLVSHVKLKLKFLDGRGVTSPILTPEVTDKSDIAVPYLSPLKDVSKGPNEKQKGLIKDLMRNILFLFLLHYLYPSNIPTLGI